MFFSHDRLRARNVQYLQPMLQMVKIELHIADLGLGVESFKLDFVADAVLVGAQERPGHIETHLDLGLVEQISSWLYDVVYLQMYCILTKQHQGRILHPNIIFL